MYNLRSIIDDFVLDNFSCNKNFDFVSKKLYKELIVFRKVYIKMVKEVKILKYYYLKKD